MRGLIVIVLLSLIAGCAPVATRVESPCIHVPPTPCKKLTAGTVGGTTIGVEDEIPTR